MNDLSTKLNATHQRVLNEIIVDALYEILINKVEGKIYDYVRINKLNGDTYESLVSLAKSKIYSGSYDFSEK